MALISIIIPCYNVEEYIDRCMNSVVNQTIGIENLEVILVNDASTDNTYDKLCEWEKKYESSIIVINLGDNVRQGGARNIGLQYSTSGYIGFVDADDWIDVTMYEKLYITILEKQCDVVRCKFIREHYEGEKQSYEDAEYGSICTGLYKKELIVGNEVYFPEGLSYEDNYWGPILALYVRQEIICEEVLYHYYINANSTTTKVNDIRHLDRLTIEEMKVEEYKKRGFFDNRYREIEWDFLRLYYLNTMYIVFNRFTYIPDIYAHIKSKIEEYFPDWHNNPYINKALPREKQLLRMLAMNHIFNVEELERIKSEYSDANEHSFRKFRAPLSGKTVHVFPEVSAMSIVN